MNQTYQDQYAANRDEILSSLEAITNAVHGMTPPDEATYDELGTVNYMMEKLAELVETFGIMR